MKTKHPTYIIADLPEPLFMEIMQLLRCWGNDKSEIPAEITLLGSSGVGPIPVGADVDFLISKVEEVAKDFSSFEMSFAGWRVFPNTTLAYLAPADRAIFDEMHTAFRDSGIPHSENPFPYNPHCTISSAMPQEVLADIDNQSFPREPFTISSIRLVDLNLETLVCSELHKVSLKNS